MAAKAVCVHSFKPDTTQRELEIRIQHVLHANVSSIYPSTNPHPGRSPTIARQEQRARTQRRRPAPVDTAQHSRRWATRHVSNGANPNAELEHLKNEATSLSWILQSIYFFCLFLTAARLKRRLDELPMF